MHKQLFIATATALGLCLSLPAFATQNGQINITGKVLDTTCTVSPTSSDVKVTLPNVDKSTLTAPNSHAGLTPFLISITGCPTSSADGSNIVSVSFIADSNVDSNGNLKNNGSANSVAVQILDNALQPINILNDPTNKQAKRGSTFNNGSAELKYFARYFSAAGNASSGDVSALAKFQLIYQ